MKQKGFSLVELLLALALTGALLASAAIAMKASFDGYDGTEKVAAATQSARGVLTRMAREVRTASAVTSPAAGQLVITPIQDGVNPQLVKYVYSGGTLYYKVTPFGGSETSYALLASTDEVTVNLFSVLLEVVTPQQGQSYTKSATVKIGFVVQSNTLSVSSTASVRQNQSY